MRKAIENNLLLADETRQIIGSAMEVLNALGHGLLEKPYENALVVEFGMRRISCRQQARFDVIYKGAKVGDYIPDRIAFDQIVGREDNITRQFRDHMRGLEIEEGDDEEVEE